MHPDTHRGERFKIERKRLGWSQQKAADAIGVRREMWAKYETGAEPGADALSAMQRAGVNVDYVLTGTTEAESLRQREALHAAGSVSEAQREANRAIVDLVSNIQSLPPQVQAAFGTILEYVATFSRANRPQEYAVKMVNKGERSAQVHKGKVIFKA